jgi:hypothetical protein
MSDQIVIDGTDIYDGNHDFDPTYFTLGEMHTIKRLSGLRRAELQDALANDDTDLWVAFAVIALQRKMAAQGRPGVIDEDVFWNAKSVTITFQEAARVEEEADAGPPATGEPSSASDDSTGTSGSDSPAGLVNPENGRPPTGTPSWASVTSGQPT